MIHRFHIQNYKALRDVAIDLAPLHVLIGPNDSGKTSILEALAALCRSVDHPLEQAFTGAWEGQQLVWQQRRDLQVGFHADIDHDGHRFSYRLACSFAPTGQRVQVADERCLQEESEDEMKLVSSGNTTALYRRVVQDRKFDEHQHDWCYRIHDALTGVQFYRWDPRFLALPVAPSEKSEFRMDVTGFGLALCLDDILGEDRDRFTALERRFTEIFPHIKSIKLVRGPAYRSPVDPHLEIPRIDKQPGKGIAFEMDNGQADIPARQASDGTLLVLAYLTVLHLPKPPRVLLVEEPENGIHPQRLADVLSILRDLISEQSDTQILMTTHSPYVLDQFGPEEVTLCRKQEDGSVSVHRLSESARVREQVDVFTLGEIWTAEGDEALSQP